MPQLCVHDCTTSNYYAASHGQKDTGARLLRLMVCSLHKATNDRVYYYYFVKTLLDACPFQWMLSDIWGFVHPLCVSLSFNMRRT